MQATRNRVVAAVLSRMGVEGARGSQHRRFFMERRGDGLPIIDRETRALAGRLPAYETIGAAEFLLRIPAAPQDATSLRTCSRW